VNLESVQGIIDAAPAIVEVVWAVAVTVGRSVVRVSTTAGSEVKSMIETTAEVAYVRTSTGRKATVVKVPDQKVRLSVPVVSIAMPIVVPARGAIVFLSRRIEYGVSTVASDRVASKEMFAGLVFHVIVAGSNRPVSDIL